MSAGADVAAAERRELLDLILRHGFEKRRVVLSSGKESDFYLDLRATMMRPRGIELAGRLLHARLADGPRVEAVGGMVVAAVPVVSAVLLAAARAGAEWRDLCGFFVRKEAKQHGLARRVEGPLLDDSDRCLVVEDVVTTGGSTIEAIEALQAERRTIVGVVSVLDRLAGGAERIQAAANAPYVPLTTIDEVYPDRPDR